MFTRLKMYTIKKEYKSTNIASLRYMLEIKLLSYPTTTQLTKRLVYFYN